MDWCPGEAAQHDPSPCGNASRDTNFAEGAKLNKCVSQFSSARTDRRWSNALQKVSFPLRFGVLVLHKILASLISLNWCVASVEEPLFQIQNNHILSQAHTVLHNWKTPIPRRILPFRVLSKKCTEFGNVWTMLIISTLSQNLQLGIQISWIRKNNF